MTDPTRYLRRKRREADPNHAIRREYARLARVVGVRVSDRPLSIRRSRMYPDKAVGTCWHDGRITVTLGVDVDAATVGALLLHELAHAVAPRCERHGDRWRSIFVEAASDAYGTRLRVTMAGDSSHVLHQTLEDQIREVLKRR